MKPIKQLTLNSVVTALAFTAILGTSSARAQNAGDLLIGFEEQGNGASSNVYEVDLGSASQFLSPSAPTQTFDLSTGDLSNYFGSSWASSTLLQYGVIGGTQTTGNLVLGSNTLAANTLFTSWNTFALAPTEKTSNTQKTSQNDINALYNDFGNTANPTTGSTVSLPAVITDATDPDGFAAENKTNANFNFGAGFSTSDLDYNSDGSTAAVPAATLDLYEVTPTNASTGAKPTDLLGTFSLGSNGNLTFTAAAAPEPSSWALIGIGALALFWNLRRRNQAV